MKIIRLQEISGLCGNLLSVPPLFRFTKNAVVEASEFLSSNGYKHRWIVDPEYFAFAKDHFRYLDTMILDRPPIANGSVVLRAIEFLRGADMAVFAGSGTTCDICKAAARTLLLPFMGVLSAPSVNAFYSYYPVIEGDHVVRLNYPGGLPDMVFFDDNLFSACPKSLRLAGIGDHIASYSAFFDCLLSESLMNDNSGKANQCREIGSVFDHLLIDSVEDIVNGDPDACEILISCLCASGFSMTFAGNSCPASMSEHSLARLMGLTYKSFSTLSHGEAVGISSSLITAVQSLLIERSELIIPTHILNKDHLLDLLPKKHSVLMHNNASCKPIYDKETIQEAFIKASSNRLIQEGFLDFPRSILKRAGYPLSIIHYAPKDIWINALKLCAIERQRFGVADAVGDIENIIKYIV